MWERSTTGGRKASARPKKRLEYLPGRLLLRIQEGAVRPALRATGLSFRASEAERLPEAVAGPLEYLRKNAGLKHVEPLFSSRRSALERASLSTSNRARLSVLSSVADSESEQLRGITLVSLDAKRVTPSLLRHLSDSGAVAIAERVPARWLAQGSDPMLNLQWGLRVIDWFASPGHDASGIRVGILDSGIDAGHPDLKGLDLEYRHAGLKARDVFGHGTHVAGIVAARTNDGVGIAGVASCRLGIWKVFPDEPESDGEFYVDGDRFLRALHEVVDAGVKVVNLSLGGTASSQTEALLFRRLEERGVTVVAAMGNEHEEGNPTEYPAAYPTVLAVGAIGPTRRRATFSNTGRHIGLVAPGTGILSTLPRSTSPYLDETDYGAWDGTSMATPHVAAAAALAVALHPDEGPAAIKDRLRRTATRLPAMRGKSWTRSYGAGLLNLRRALG